MYYVVVDKFAEKVVMEFDSHNELTAVRSLIPLLESTPDVVLETMHLWRLGSVSVSSSDVNLCCIPKFVSEPFHIGSMLDLKKQHVKKEESNG